MYVLTILLAVCLTGSAVLAGLPEKPYYDLEDSENLFKNFIEQYKKTYTAQEYNKRLQIFKKNLEDINYRNSIHPYTVYGVNRFADLALEEMKQYTGFKVSNATIVKVTIPDGPVPAPAALDWRDKGLVSPVQDQGSCGSCFIFGAIGNIEGQYALKHQECPNLSESQALDCLSCASCNGGYMAEVMQEFAKRAGVMSEEDYPYTPSKGTCHEDKSKVVARVLSGSVLNVPDEDTLMQKLADIGPLGVSLASEDLQKYQGNILVPHDCVGQSPDHAVLLVGYGEENGQKFWIIKNSWGAGWGEAGYFRLQRGVNACEMGTSYTATAEVA